ncbi:RNA polymerase subunit sigma-70 [Dactylosporangium matsuzakiense]|uniref:ECF RNA polymerase sigma factor SigG n=1 Tax=Dactylosporangium matsuzakiense TaxID=53360 RepID=A0A9W6KHI8_9ACTN|nr:RNA polymerase subunit sigma-70 [Dactylosporangium matsuzakiense]GLL02221.1 ECF RNA polymerase sigma factor SigG [Dactylosporangium matsuzakiense]
MTRTTPDRARAGDADAFGELTEPYRRELLLHCYRILGSLTDAEDVLQETMIAAWRGLGGFEGRASIRGWLYRIATNQCLNTLRAHRRRIPTEPVPPFQPPQPSRRGEVPWLQPYPDTLLDQTPDTTPDPEARYQMREAVELAFVTALQRMPPRQAATLVLRDVLGFSAAEVAVMLATTPTAVKGTLQRARAALQAHRGTGRPAPAPGSATEHELVRSFADAFVAADLDRLLGLLTDDAWLSMPPATHEYHGRPAIAEFLRASWAYRDTRQLHLIPARANTQPALAVYTTGPDGGTAHPAGLVVLTLAGHRIGAITRFHTDHLLPRFGLPDILAGSGH